MRNQKGFGLIELMITLGILSFVMLGTLAALQNALMVSQTADQKANLTSLVSSSAGMALNQVTCTLAVTKVQQTYGTPFHFDTLQDGANLGPYSLTVKSVFYANPVLITTAFDGTKVYYGTLTLVATSNKAILGSQTFAPRLVAAVYIATDPAGVITQCGPQLPALPQPPVPPAPQAPEVKTFDFDADPQVCENFPVKARCPASQKIVVTNAAYGANCGGVPANYGQDTVQSMCNGQQNCDFTAGNVNNCTQQGVFVDPSLNCPKSFHMAYHCE